MRKRDANKDLRFTGEVFQEAALVLIRWLYGGKRLEETVPIKSARKRRLQLESEGATVYWNERVVPSQ